MKFRKLLIIFLLPYLGFTQQVKLSWLGNQTSKYSTGVSWGVPFKKGEINKNQKFQLIDSVGNTLPLQQWNLAYWPDGTPKWIGFATVASPSKSFSLQKATSIIKPEKNFEIKENQDKIQVSNRKISCIFSKKGTSIIDSLQINNRLIASQGTLICIHQDAYEANELDAVSKRKFVSEIEKVSIEQNGDIRSVIKVEGKFQANSQKWLPFILRFYFYAQSAEIRVVHTIIYDGNQEKDFIKGLGISFQVPFREETLNRHIRFGGENNGIWAEPIQPLTGRRTLIHSGKNVYEKQILGERVPNTAEYDEKGKALIKDWATWGDFRLMQHSADGFMIQKRTQDKSAWIDANGGKRANGIIFVGDVSGGISVGVKDFWQSYPASLEIKKANTAQAELRAWLWSPYADAMDMRHYDTTAHGLEASYEDIEAGFSTPTGVARTSEMSIFLHEKVPSNEFLSHFSENISQKQLLVCSPKYLHDAQTFGVWSLPDYSSDGKKWIERQLDNALNFYKTEIENRHWYGFWNYGDVMHGYDATRHSWRYDIGGYAWANTELAPDMWLWYSFLRTGRSDVFRMAEAMTRHTSEVDVYHVGRLAGLGSRHNVRHWGCGAKEVRISQAAWKRFYYYLTTDERMGDLMTEVANAEDVIAGLDPLRHILPKSQQPTHARVGPDWLAMVGNWMTQWERTNDEKWKKKIEAGISSFTKMPYGFFSGKEGAFGFDNKTVQLYQLAPEDIGNSHLASIMGGAEIAFELNQFIDNKDFSRLWLQYSELYGASKSTVKETFGKEATLGELSPHYARLPAYVAYMRKDEKLAHKAWEVFFNTQGKPWFSPFEPVRVSTPLVLRDMIEIPNVSTNNTAQWSLNAIEILELIGDKIPEKHPNWNK